jgi:hypothetical protein
MATGIRPVRTAADGDGSAADVAAAEGETEGRADGVAVTAALGDEGCWTGGS